MEEIRRTREVRNGKTITEQPEARRGFLKTAFASLIGFAIFKSKTPAAFAGDPALDLTPAPPGRRVSIQVDPPRDVKYSNVAELLGENILFETPEYTWLKQLIAERDELLHIVESLGFKYKPSDRVASMASAPIEPGKCPKKNPKKATEPARLKIDLGNPAPLIEDNLKMPYDKMFPEPDDGGLFGVS